jgi:hypothetical protein
MLLPKVLACNSRHAITYNGGTILKPSLFDAVKANMTDLKSYEG